MYTRTDPNIHITKCTCSLILRPKGRAETLQLTYSCQLLAVYIQYKHINYTDISQIKYKHIYYKFLIKVYCVKYKVLDICFLHLENTFQLNLYSANYWGIYVIWRVSSPGPNCPAPKCPGALVSARKKMGPLFQSGQSGPGQGPKSA